MVGPHQLNTAVPPRHCSRPMWQSILGCFMCFEVPSVHHDIHRLEGREVGTFFEYMSKDLLPEGLPCLSICLIRQGCVSLKSCRRVANHKTRQGIKAPSSKPVSWQRFIQNFVTPLCMREPNGRRCDRGHSREPDIICPTHARPFINFHGQGSSTRFHVIWVRFSVRRTNTDSSNSIREKWGRHVHNTRDHLQQRTTTSCLGSSKRGNSGRDLCQQRTTTPCLA